MKYRSMENARYLYIILELRKTILIQKMDEIQGLSVH